MDSLVREPKQKRAIEKKERIIKSGFELICKKGFHNINTVDIAKAAEVSTGIVYQYFQDKHDILMCGLEKYGSEIFYPMFHLDKDKKITKDNYSDIIKEMLEEYTKNHKVSKTAHEEITAMIHSDKEVAEYYYKRELEMTSKIKNYLLDCGFKSDNLSEKVHVMMGIVDNFCHEVIYHHHRQMNYNTMANIVVDSIYGIFADSIA